MIAPKKALQNPSTRKSGIICDTKSNKSALTTKINIPIVTMMNGMLKVFLEKIIPEHKKPKKIEVKETDSEIKSSKKSKAQLLTEDPLERDL